MEEPPPLPRLRAPPSLPDELVEVILLRSPPDDPASLVRAALVCKRWSRLVSARAFRRRFRDFHLQRRGAPMLGFLHNVSDLNEGFSASFVRTSASCPPLDTQRGWLALDARGGRVLLRRAVQHAFRALFDRDDAASAVIRLAVWDPLSAAAASRLELPVPVLPRRPEFWNAALLCCDQNGLQEDNAGGSFRVGTDPEGTFAFVYSSLEPAAWSEPIYRAHHPDPGGAAGGYIDTVRGALVRNAFYFLFHGRTSILRYDLATGDMCVTRLPPASQNGRMVRTVLTTTEDGGLGFARVQGDKLCLWSMEEARPNSGALAVEWIQRRVIDFRSLLPVIDLLGFADGLGIILVGTIDGFFSVDQKSGRIDRLVDGPGFYRDIVPYMSFCTLDEGPSANA